MGVSTGVVAVSVWGHYSCDGSTGPAHSVQAKCRTGMIAALLSHLYRQGLSACAVTVQVWRLYSRGCSTGMLAVQVTWVAGAVVRWVGHCVCGMPCNLTGQIIAYLGPSSHSRRQCNVQSTSQALQEGQGDSSREESAAAGMHIILIVCRGSRRKLWLPYPCLNGCSGMNTCCCYTASDKC
jgi:hypothetical protein